MSFPGECQFCGANADHETEMCPACRELLRTMRNRSRKVLKRIRKYIKSGGWCPPDPGTPLGGRKP